LIAEALATGTPAPDELHLARYTVDADAGNWSNAVDEARAYQDALMRSDRPTSVLHTQAEPLLANALAQTGDLVAAHRVVDRTPVDCYSCLVMRGNIDVLEGNRKGAAYWYARAVYAAPSLPFAYTDWGRVLLQAADFDNAAEKFTLANQKGPHFADPLEMWGEALMAKSQSHLALAKFQEADKYAPNWGRLHLKWGEALVYAGKKGDAKAQFSRAAQLDLTPGEKTELARQPLHG
jgi:tetratricopeptide (TPR) repeat protein